MKKKVLVLLLIVAIVSSLAVGLAACNDEPDFKVGLICLHDETSTYDKNFIDAMNAVKAELGLSDEQVIIVRNIPEEDKCYQEACDLAEQGCDIIFANSFGHEPYMMRAAEEYPDVVFSHATGTKAHTSDLDNYVNSFASIYEGRYLAGIAAGMKLNEMIADGEITEGQAKMGYVGAFPYAEVISGFTSFYLGAKSVCPTVTMDVTFTNSWFDPDKEGQSATALINGGCVLISQHADSWGAPTVCQAEGVPNVSYNGSTISAGPDTYIISSRIDWAPYYKYAIQCAQNGTAIDTDWTGTIATGSVKLTDINTAVAADGTQAAINTAIEQLNAGTLHVFDTANFTVTIIDLEGYENDVNTNATVDADGKLLTYTADVDDAGDYVGETQVVIDGIFKESYFRSAPYFDLWIDGITNLSA